MLCAEHSNCNSVSLSHVTVAVRETFIRRFSHPQHHHSSLLFSSINSLAKGDVKYSQIERCIHRIRHQCIMYTQALAHIMDGALSDGDVCLSVSLSVCLSPTLTLNIRSAS